MNKKTIALNDTFRDLKIFIAMFISIVANYAIIFLVPVIN